MKLFGVSTFLAGALLVGCSATSLDSTRAELGINKGLEEMTAQIQDPGPIVFEKHIAANWAVERSGLINMDHPKAVAAGVVDQAEPIALYAYTVTHPKHGTFMIDSGISEQFL